MEYFSNYRKSGKNYLIVGNEFTLMDQMIADRELELFAPVMYRYLKQVLTVTK